MDKDTFIEQLLRERDEMYLELSRLRKIDQGALDQAELKNEKLEKLLLEKDEKLEKLTQLKDEQIRKLTDQLAWYRHKFWKPSSEKFVAPDPSQRKIDWDGLDVVPEEKEIADEVIKEVITYERKKQKKNGQAKRAVIPADLRREIEVIDPEGIDETWIKIGEEITEIIELKPGEAFVRQIVRNKYAKKN